MGYDQYTVPETLAVEPTFVAFIYHWQTYVHGKHTCYSFKFLSSTHKTFWECHVHFFQQPFTKLLYGKLEFEKLLSRKLDNFT